MNRTIYIILNIVNDKKYIGKTKDFKGREKYHKRKLSSNKHHSRHLQNAWNFYGKDSFIFGIIEENVESDSELNFLEKYYIKAFDTLNGDYGYNSTEGGDGASGYVHTEEDIIKMKKGQLNRPNKQSTFLGKHHTEESKANISKNISGEKNGMFNKNHTEETKFKISEKMKIINKERLEKTEYLYEKYIPEVKSLLEKNHTQTYIAKLLEIPQPVVSLIKNNKYKNFDNNPVTNMI